MCVLHEDGTHHRVEWATIATCMEHFLPSLPATKEQQKKNSTILSVVIGQRQVVVVLIDNLSP